MNIAHVIESSGGSIDFVVEIVEYLKDHTHHVIYGDRAAPRLNKAKGHLANLKMHHWDGATREISIGGDIRAIINLYKILKNIPHDVVHLHSSKAGFHGRIVCFLQRDKKVIYTPNGLAFERKDVSRIVAWMYVFLERVAAVLNGKVIGCSASEAGALIRKGIYAEFINNGTRVFDHPPKPWSPGEPLVIATTGRVTQQKDPALFNEIAAHFKNDPTCKFVWIGGGDLEHLLASKNIEITGWVERSKVIQTLEHAHIYLSTAGWEGLPFAVLEAMNLSKPLILTDCVGNVDLVIEGLNGFQFRTAPKAIEKLKYLKDNPQEILNMGEASHHLAITHYEVGSMARKYELAYLAMINKK